MPIYKMTGRAHLSNIGRFFQRLVTNLFRFKPRELEDLSDYLLEKVKQYVPVRTGVLKSSLVAEAKASPPSIQVVARSHVLMSSAYAKEYAQFVEAGVFGKDISRLIRTPDYGGPTIIRSPYGEGGMDGLAYAIVSNKIAHEVVNGYAQFMRAGIYDAMPRLLHSLKRIIDSKYVQEHKELRK